MQGEMYALFCTSVLNVAWEQSLKPEYTLKL